ncbi:MAG TPA: dockerin type I repeat-containing protein, partial [Planctomycetota bacterium]|nr:dockerin type I repeat-containing protein [Planctomycetota bacterium]
WKIYAKRMANLSQPAADLVIDTNMFLQQPTASIGCYLDIAGRFLLYQGAESKERESPVRILLLDLESPALPIELRSPEEPKVWLKWPSISEDFAVWTESRGFFDRRAWAQPLENGVPVGAPFVMTQGTSGGSWITIDRNVAVWTGTAFRDNVPLSSGIIASELPLVADDIGDVDQNGQRNLTDVVAILNFLFRGGWEPRRRLADTNGDGSVELSDAVELLRFLFVGESTELLR